MERHPDRSDQGWTARPVALVLLGMVLLLYALPAWSTQTVRVGIYDNPPKVFLTPNGVAAGLYPDILDAIARERGWTLAWVSGTWQECLDRLKSGEIDLMIDIAKTKERSLLFRFSQEPVLTNWGAVYARKGVAVQSFQDLKDRSVAVVKGSAHTEGLQGFRHLMTFFKIPCRYIEVDSYRQAMMLLDSAQVDACVVNRLFGSLYAPNFDVTPDPPDLQPKSPVFCRPQAGRPGQTPPDPGRRKP